MSITVKDLISHLLGFDGNLPVRVETKDGEEVPLTESDVYDITLGTSNKRVLIYVNN